MPASPQLDLDLTVLSDNLLRAVSQVGRAVAASTFPALGCLLLQASGSSVRLVGASQDQAITTWIGGVLRSEGSVLLPHKDLYETIATWPRGVQLRLTQEHGRHRIVVHAPGFNTTLDVLPAEEFPLVPVLEAPGGLTFEHASELTGLLERVRGACATDNARPVLTGVHFKTVHEFLLLEGADGLRLHQARVRLGTPKVIDVVVPAGAVGHACALLDPGSSVTLLFVEKDGRVARVGFIQDSLQVLANTLEFPYPDLTSLIPDMRQAPAISASLSGAGLLSALARADRLADLHRVRLKLTPGTGVTPGTLVLRSEQAERGGHVESLAANISAPLEIAVNARLLISLITAHDQEGNAPLALRLSGPKESLSVRNESFIGVLMPMHLGQ